MNPTLSWNVVTDFDQLTAYHFMTNALIAGTIVAVLAAVVGWFMVLRRQSFAGHTLAVVGFPGAAGAIWLGLPLMVGYFGFCFAAALVIAVVPYARSDRQNEESAVTGTVQAFALAGGILFVNLYKGFLNGVDALLFGNFLGITNTQILVLLVVAIGAVGVLACIGRPLFFSTIDAEVASTRGVPSRLLSVVFLLLLAAAVAEVSQITGSLLVFALLVMPTATAQRITTRPTCGLLLSVALGIVVTWIGLGAAYFSPYPVGFWLTSVAFAIYVVTTIATRGTPIRLRHARSVEVAR